MAEGFLTVKQILARAGIVRNTLYNWEKSGKIPTARRNRSGHRVYTEEDAKKIEAYAKSTYVPIEQVKKGMNRRTK